jgi:NADH-quinone oxidoreductase subunit N
LAYSGISHAGYLLLLLLSAEQQPVSALLFYSLAYVLSTIAAFAIAIPVFSTMKSENINAFNGLGKKNPVLAAALSMAMLGLAGIPPFAGFLGKFYIFTESLQAGFFYTTLIAIINSIIGVYYYFKVIVAMYGKPGNDEKVSLPFTFALVLVVCLALSLLLGIYPSPILSIF